MRAIMIKRKKVKNRRHSKKNYPSNHLCFEEKDSPELRVILLLTVPVKPPLNTVYCVHLEYPIWPFFFIEKDLKVVKNTFFTQIYLHVVQMEKWQWKRKLSQVEGSG